ncbi:stress-activated map kinase interacting protein 1-domain-containing protein [Morchella snyderi]|nr:stress-activated map kinase interacting protein 1-domain-containing protein [Morchella snyderi]
MSLLQHQDFVLYRIRNRYLHTMKDGVGERLISINPTALTIPAFKNAGWGSPSEIRRTYSPPIPVGAETEYFALREVGVAVGAAPNANGNANGNGNGGSPPLFEVLMSGSAGGREQRRRAREREREAHAHREVDDSSVSEDSEEEEGGTAPSTRIQFDFPKKEIAPRPRSGSSPIRSGPQVLVTSPSKSRTRRLRGGSHGDVDFVKSTLHTSNIDRLPDADEDLLSSGIISAEKLHARITDRLRSSPNSSLPRDAGFESPDDSDDTASISSDFPETADSNPAVLGGIGMGMAGMAASSSLSTAMRRRLPQNHQHQQHHQLQELQELHPHDDGGGAAVLHALPPPIRPVSQLQPVSALTQLLAAKSREAENPLEGYRLFSGKGELTPITLHLYIPYSRSKAPIDVILNRLPKQRDSPSARGETTVAEAIGFTLYKYIEDKCEPALTDELCDINMWTFRMVDDGEPDEDFPPLERTQPVTAYIVKKTGRGGRGARDMKMEGEFAMVQATPEQYLENCRATPTERRKPSTTTMTTAPLTACTSASTCATPITPSATAPSATPASPSTPTTTTIGLAATTDHATPATKTGPSKIIRIHISTIDEFAQSVSVCVTSDTFIAEVLDQVCRKKHLDKSKYILRLTGHPNVIWPLERTVAALGDRAELDLVKKKMLPVPATVVAPAAAAAAAALPMLAQPPPPVQEEEESGRRMRYLQPSAAWAPDMLGSRDYLKYTVWRKAGMSFMSRHERILAIDGEYVHIMPSLAQDSSKTTSIHISTIVGCKTYRKQPSLFKIVVLRPQREMKRYDFEAVSAEQAVELVAALREGMGRFGLQ